MINQTVSIIIITYNNADTIKRCLSSIKKQMGVKLEIILVDNASTDQTVSILKKDSNLKIIIRNENGGFAKAANEGVKIATGFYILFLNPDTELEQTAIAELIQVIQKDRKIAMVGGKFISPIGNPMVSFGNFPSLLTEFFQKIRLHKIFPVGRYIVPSLFSQGLFNKSHQVDWVSGGFCLIKKDIFEEVGGFDENYFLYIEDIDLAKRIKDKGYKIVFCSQAKAVHHQYRSSSEVAKKYEKVGLKYYKEKYM